MRKYLNLPEEYVPNTHKAKAGAVAARVGPERGHKTEGERAGGRGGGLGGEYRTERPAPGGGRGGGGF